MKFLTIKAIRGYQKFISPAVGPSCRFHPTCSEYALQAVERFGFIKGSFLALKRILKCNPWGGSGFDPLPGENTNGPS